MMQAKWLVVAGLMLVACGGTAIIDAGSGAGSGSGGSSSNASATNGATSSSGAGGTCGDAEVMARYQQCLMANNESACDASGGFWTIVGLSPEPECQCPTGQRECPCTGPDDCLSSCIAELGPNGCGGVTEGRCSADSITVGCYCFFIEPGVPSSLCVD